jgi:hypothetical protein
MVNIWNLERRSLPWLWLGFIALAIAVFTWGLGYKLSLYDPPQARSHEIPQAKLLSKNEQAIAVQSPLLKDTADPSTAASRVLSSVTILLVWALVLQPLSSFRLFRLETRSSRPLRNCAALTRFFFLPPPMRA